MPWKRSWTIPGRRPQFSGDIVAVCCGAINSAALLLLSANDKHPHGLANSSDMVGRHFMFHQADAILAIGKEPNRSSYMKTFTLNDFYFGDKDYPYPMGNVQPIGSFHHEMMKADAPPLTPGFRSRNDDHPRRAVVADDGRSARPEQSRDRSSTAGFAWITRPTTSSPSNACETSGSKL